jgi:hypothetical protein
MRPSTNSPSRLAPTMRNSSKSCATSTLSKLKYGTYRTMATITARLQWVTATVAI